MQGQVNRRHTRAGNGGIFDYGMRIIPGNQWGHTQKHRRHTCQMNGRGWRWYIVQWPHPFLYKQQGMKRFSGAAWTSARNDQRSSYTPNNRTFCIHTMQGNIVSNTCHTSVTPRWPWVNSKLEVYCKKSFHEHWTCKTDFRYGVVNNGAGNIRKCVEPSGTHATSTERVTKHCRNSCNF